MYRKTPSTASVRFRSRWQVEFSLLGNFQNRLWVRRLWSGTDGFIDVYSDFHHTDIWKTCERWFLRLFIDSLCIPYTDYLLLEIHGALPCIQHLPERQWQAERTSIFLCHAFSLLLLLTVYRTESLSIPYDFLTLPYSFVMVFLNVYETCGFLHFPSDKLNVISCLLSPYPPAKYQSVKNKISGTNHSIWYLHISYNYMISFPKALCELISPCVTAPYVMIDIHDKDCIGDTYPFLMHVTKQLLSSPVSLAIVWIRRVYNT